MKTTTAIALALCLALAGCQREERERVDPSVPMELEAAIALFCRDAGRAMPRGSHVIVRKNDIKSGGSASSEYIHWAITQSFTGRRGIRVYNNDNVAASDIKDKGEIFIVSARLEAWEGSPFYKGFFDMDKNGVKGANVSVLRKQYTVTTEGRLSELIRQQAVDEAESKRAAEQAAADSAAAAVAAAAKEMATGFLTIVNESAEYNIIGLRIYRGKEVVVDKGVFIRYPVGSETYELRNGTYQVSIKNDINNAFCSIGSVKVASDSTTTKTYKGCGK